MKLSLFPNIVAKRHDFHRLVLVTWCLHTTDNYRELQIIVTFLPIDYYLDDTKIHKTKKSKKKNHRISETSVVIKVGTENKHY